MNDLTPTTLRRAADPAILRNLSDRSGTFVTALFDSSPDCIQLIELDGSLSYMNPHGQCAMEIDDFETVSGQSYALLWPAESQVKVSLAVAAARVGQSSRIEAFIPRGDGSAHWWDLSISPVLSPDGDVVRILSIARDVTGVVAHEDRLRSYEKTLTDLNASLSKELRLRDVLMREIDHRVKNSLSMIASILRLQSRDTQNDEARRKLSSAASRVSTVARVHERLQLDDDMSVVALADYLPTIAADVTDALSRRDVRLSADIAPVSVGSDAAASLGMIAAELITNAFKHAFAGRGGTVHMQLTRSTPDELRLIIRDDGSGGCALSALTDRPTAGDRNGLGTRIVQLQTNQLGGRLSCDSPAGIGTTITLDFPG